MHGQPGKHNGFLSGGKPPAGTGREFTSDLCIRDDGAGKKTRKSSQGLIAEPDFR